VNNYNVLGLRQAKIVDISACWGRGSALRRRATTTKVVEREKSKQQNQTFEQQAKNETVFH
jgi:hypothetical protein